MGTKIIKLTESDLYRIVKRVINEQEEESEDNSYFTLGNTGLAFRIVDGRLWSIIFDENGEPVLDKNLNGVLSDFKVDFNTKEVIGSEFKSNVKLINDNWNNIKRANAAPRQTVFEYKFIAIVPNDAPQGSAPKGAPIIYTAQIAQAPQKNYYKVNRKYTQSENGEVGEKVFYKKGGWEYVLQVSSGDYVMDYHSGEPKEDEIPNEKPFELNIESPFEFDKVTLSNDAKLAFNKFIESVKENYNNVQGDVEVICSASIDGAPDQKRIDYDMNLSKKRAEAIVSILKSSLPGTKLNFIPKGIGQTDQFAPGKKFPEVKDTNQTAPNRRLIIKLPQIMKQQ